MKTISSARSGTVLIVVMWVCFSLVSLALLCGQSQLIAYRGTDARIAAGQARLALEGGARYARHVVASLEEPGQLPRSDTYACEAAPVGEATYWFIGREGNASSVVLGLAASAESPAFGLVDEAAKLNLNTATEEMLEGLPYMTSELAAAIVDWRDSDDDVTEGGAEAETYLLKDPPYACKNGPFETVEELRLVEGIDDVVLYGEDTNRNGFLDPNEDDGNASPPDDDADGELDAGLLEYVTVYTCEQNVRADGSARINVNSAQEELATALGTELGASRAAEIMQRLRAQREYRSLLEVYVRGGVTTAEAASVEDMLTVSGAEALVGRVNVNTAPSVVLACLPGVDESEAASLVAYRTAHDDLAGSVAWVAEVLDNDSAIAAGPYLTARCSQVSADVAALGRHGRGYRRELFVIDFSGDEPACVYRKDLTGYGWGLGHGVFDGLFMRKEL